MAFVQALYDMVGIITTNIKGTAHERYRTDS